MSEISVTSEGTSAAGRPRWKRVLMKMSGEALLGGQASGHDRAVLERLASDVAAVQALGVQQCLVIGGGNIVRGASLAGSGIDRASADYMGMLGTVINALAVQAFIERAGVPTRVMSAIPMSAVCEPYIRRRAIRHLEKGRVVLFAAGTGNPFFTTDTGAALRAAEMNCEAILKGTQVDGVYTADPKKDPHATRYERLSYQKVLADDLRVMDASAIALARESRIPIVVFRVREAGAYAQVVQGRGPHTVIGGEEQR
jgi:uridylate kinase